MRLLAISLLLATGLHAEFGFKTGQGARLVVGQTTFTAQESGVSPTLLGAVSGLAYANNMLFVSDANRLNAEPLNHRALIYKNVSGKLPAPADPFPVNGVRCQVCVGVADLALGQKDRETGELKVTNADSLRVPVGIASDGVRLAIADTDNNRVLIWDHIPTTDGEPANVVVGQEDFQKAVSTGFNPTARSLKGPQGVWIQDGRLFVADTSNNRILIWNSIPTQNNTPADVVLGQRDFTSFVQPDLTQAELAPKADTLLTPVSVTSDGQRLYVADLGHNRVLIWNGIPTQNQAPADIVVGQPDFETAISNNARGVCESDGEDADGNPLYPARCAATLDFPRFALSDGRMLFIADGGNDRVLVFNQLPAQNGAAADAVLGQINEKVNLVSDSAFPEDVSSAGTVRTPQSLAWDGANLYVSDPFNRRVMVFTAAEQRLPRAGVRNAASFEVHAVGGLTVSGEIQNDDVVTVKIRDEREYKYTVKEGDELEDVVFGIVAAINAEDGDPEVFASPNPEFRTVILTARVGGEIGNTIAYSASVNDTGKIIVNTASSSLAGGEEATKIAPGSIITLIGDQFSDVEAVAPAGATELPRELGGVQVYIDGIRAPLYYVSPKQINAQIPVEVFDAESSNAYVRTVHSDGRVVVSNAVAVPIIQYNPGIFAAGGIDPRPAMAVHSSSHATGVVSVDGQAKAGDRATVKIRDERTYTYTVKTEDVPAEGQPARGGLEKIRDGLIALINEDPEVRAEATGIFATRIRLVAREPAAAGLGVTYSASVEAGTGDAGVILTATTTELCCANEAGALVTESNPAIAGEIITVYATGLGLVQPDAARSEQKTGLAYNGPLVNEPVEFVSSLAGGRTANVLSAALEPGTIGLFRVDLQLNSGLPTNPQTEVTIAQGFQVSNIVSIPVFQPNPEEE
ncbi:MAG: hypothetical protein KIT09_34620 [Bryobacteraceae bacterium]|nr:hypothetical protein [Bryobacteraceae bacterium]